MKNLIEATRPKAAATKLKRMGRKGDTDLVHVNRRELAILDRLSPGGKVNPATGLREFNDDEGGGPVELGMDHEVTVDPETGAIQVGGPAERGMLDRMMDYSTVGQVVAALNRAGEATVRAGGPAEARGASRGDGYGNNVSVSGNGPGVDGDSGAGAGGAETGGEPAPVVNPAPTTPAAPLNSDRPRQITGAGTNGISATRTFIQEALSRARQNLGGGDPVQPPVIVDDAARSASSAGDSTMDSTMAPPTDIQAMISKLTSGMPAALPEPTGPQMGLPPDPSVLRAAGARGMSMAGSPLQMQTGPSSFSADGSNVGGDRLAKIKALVAGSGRRGDTNVAHLSSGMQRILQILGGSGAKNPQTGLREFAPVMAADNGGADSGGGNDYVKPIDEGTKYNGNDEGVTNPPQPTGPTPVNTIEPWLQAGYNTPEEWTKGFGDLASEAGRINMTPGGDYSPAAPYGSIAQRRDALLSNYSDPQARFIASRYYGGAGVSDAGFNRQALLDAIKQGDEKFYKSIGPTPTDTVVPPEVKPPVVTPRPGIGGVDNGGSDILNRAIGAVPPSDPNQSKEAQNAGIMRWLQTNAPSLLRGNSSTENSTPIATPGNLNAVSASTNLVRAPVTSRRFRSRRYRSAQA